MHANSQTKNEITIYITKPMSFATTDVLFTQAWDLLMDAHIASGLLLSAINDISRNQELKRRL